MHHISQRTVTFLRQLDQNNNREWFAEHKKDYQVAKQDWEDFINALIARVGKHMELGPLTAKDCMYRVNRDVRFSPDKTPYNTHVSAVIAPDGKKTKQAPFYIRIKPTDKSGIGGGIWYADGKTLAALRQEIDYNAEALQGILSEKKFGQFFDGMDGEKLKRPPKGYDKDHPHIEWLKMKQFMLHHEIKADVYLADGFLDYAEEAFLAMKPFLDFMNTVLLEEN
ncbi:MAG: DUF2461 domain-containing protein [Bacteroidota bacterium]